MSLAGLNYMHGEETPMGGKKELEEQEMVTRFIHESLKGKVYTHFFVSELISTRAGNLWHYKNIRFLGNIGVTSGLRKTLLRALHREQPAVCGLVPKMGAKRSLS